MFNAYPDSIGQKLSDTVELLKRPELEDCFSLFYILPTFFNSDLDRGFSVIDYDLNGELVSQKDLEDLKALGIGLKFDLVLNHLSVASPQFKDMITRGEESPYKDFFINWDEFWKGHGEYDKEKGYIVPDKKYLDKLFMRKPGLPILKVGFPDGTERPYWNTFYQEINKTPDGKKTYLGQMDLNAQSEKVWDFYRETLEKLKNHGGTLIRLDAFAYLHKEIGQVNFFNKPGTWEYLGRLRDMAKEVGLVLLPEIHCEYGQGLHREVASEGYPIYDFFFPGLILDALDRGTNRYLLKWIRELTDLGVDTVNMLGCHDGIPVLDLKDKEVEGALRPGLMPQGEIDAIVDRILERGGRVKNLYGADGKKISYYQVNATFYSALGESNKKFLLARAVQLFMPGIPQVWYLDLFVGKNNYKAADTAGTAGHKEINRTALGPRDIEDGLKKQIVQDQLKLLRIRNTCGAFEGKFHAKEGGSENLLELTWDNGTEKASLRANLKDHSFSVLWSRGELKF